MLGSRSESMQSGITECSTGQSANHLHHRGDDESGFDGTGCSKLFVSWIVSLKQKKILEYSLWFYTGSSMA